MEEPADPAQPLHCAPKSELLGLSEPLRWLSCEAHAGGELIMTVPGTHGALTLSWACHHQTRPSNNTLWPFNGEDPYTRESQKQRSPIAAKIGCLVYIICIINKCFLFLLGGEVSC